MINFFKSIFCKHEYLLLKKFKKDSAHGIAYEPENYVAVYCPKCCKQQTMKVFDFELYQSIQEINAERKKAKEVLKDNDTI